MDIMGRTVVDKVAGVQDTTCVRAGVPNNPEGRH